MHAARRSGRAPGRHSAARHHHAALGAAAAVGARQGGPPSSPMGLAPSALGSTLSKNVVCARCGGGGVAWWWMVRRQAGRQERGQAAPGAERWPACGHWLACWAGKRRGAAAATGPSGLAGAAGAPQRNSRPCRRRRSSRAQRQSPPRRWRPACDGRKAQVEACAGSGRRCAALGAGRRVPRAPTLLGASGGGQALRRARQGLAAPAEKLAGRVTATAACFPTCPCAPGAASCRRLLAPAAPSHTTTPIPPPSSAPSSSSPCLRGPGPWGEPGTRQTWWPALHRGGQVGGGGGGGGEAL